LEYQREECAIAEKGTEDQGFIIIKGGNWISAVKVASIVFPGKSSIAFGEHVNEINHRFINRGPPMPPEPHYLSAVFVGCTVYQGAFGEWHQTKFRYEIGRRNPVRGGFAFALVSEGDIKPDDLAFSQSIEGNSAN
jgi:hypothetical protein